MAAILSSRRKDRKNFFSNFALTEKKSLKRCDNTFLQFEFFRIFLLKLKEFYKKTL